MTDLVVHRNSNYYAWLYLLQLRYETEQIHNHFASIFDKEDASDMWGFSRMHKAIFGFFGTDFAQLIQKYATEINFEDNQGQTPLWWAIKRDEPEKVKMLLLNGAKSKPGELLNYSKILGGPTLEIAKLFVKAGSDVNFIPDNGAVSAFHLACRWSPHFVPYFLDCGADVNQTALGESAETPLAMCIGSSTSTLETAQRLLAAGAKVTGSDGLKAFAAVLEVNHQVFERVEWLILNDVNYIGCLVSPIDINTLGPLNHEGECRWQMMEGATILHAIAYVAHLDIIRYLTSAKLQGLADVVDQKDDVGYTARDYFWFRLHQGEPAGDDNDSSVEELYSEDDDEDYEPSNPAGSDGQEITDSDSESETGSDDAFSVTSQDQHDASREKKKEDEDEILTSAFETFLASLKLPDRGIAEDDEDREEFFDAPESVS